MLSQKNDTPPAKIRRVTCGVHSLWLLAAVVLVLCECRAKNAGGLAVTLSLARLLGYLVDPASSHMLVSKIKPCMSKYKRLYCETANGSLNQLWFI